AATTGRRVRGASPTRTCKVRRNLEDTKKYEEHEELLWFVLVQEFLRDLRQFFESSWFRLTVAARFLPVLHSKAMPSSNAVFNGHRRVPAPVNEPIRSYAPGTPERASLKSALEQMSREKVVMPLIIGGKEVKTGECGQSVMPHDHRHVLGEYHKAGEKHVLQAVEAARAPPREWGGRAFAECGPGLLSTAPRGPPRV